MMTAKNIILHQVEIPVTKMVMLRSNRLNSTNTNLSFHNAKILWVTLQLIKQGSGEYKPWGKKMYSQSDANKHRTNFRLVTEEQN